MKNNKRILLICQFINIFGTQIYTFAMSYYLLKQTGSGIIFSLSLALGMLPQFLCSPFAGVIADRFNRQKIMILTDFLAGILLLLFFLMGMLTDLKILFIYTLMLFLSALSVFNSVSLQAAIPTFLEPSQLSGFNSLNQSVTSTARITAPFIGGIIIFLIDIRWFLLLNAISFFAASILESRLVSRQDSKSDPGKISTKTFFADMQEGIRYCRSHSLIHLILLFMICMNFLFQFGFTVPIPYIITNTLHMNSNQFGMIQSMTSLGALITSLIMSRIFQIDKIKQWLIAAISCMALLLCVFGIATIVSITVANVTLAILEFSILSFLFGGAIVASNIPINVLLQIQSDDSSRGRVMGISSMITSSISPVGVILSGLLLDSAFIKPYAICIVSGVLLFVFNLLMNRRMGLLS